MLSHVLIALASLLSFVTARPQSNTSGNVSTVAENATSSCGACEIVFFPYIVAWNESNNPNGAVDNITVATVVLTVDNSTNVTSTYTSTASTTINSKIVTFNGTAAVKTFTITAGNPSSSGDLTFTTAVTSPTAIICWGAWSVQGPYQTANSAGGSTCTSSPLLSTSTAVAFSSLTTYPPSAYPAPYTGDPVPTSSLNDVPFGTAAAEAFLGLFPSIPVFASCTLISYHGAPDYVSAVSHLTSTSTRYVQAQAVGNPAPSTATTESSPTQSPITQAPAASASAIQPVTIQAPPVPSPSTQPSTLPSPSTVSSGGSPTPSSVGPENTSANSQSPSFESHSTISAFSINPTSVQSSGSGSSVNPASAPVVGSQTLIPGSSAITITGTGTPISVHSSATEAPLGSSTLGFEGPIMSGIGGLPTSSVNASATPSQGGVVPFTGGSSGVKSLSVTVLLSICGMIEVLFL